MQRQGSSPTPVGPADFQLMKVVGKGGYGKVVQARGKQCGKIYALKVVDKPDSAMDENHLRNEIKVLQNIKSPFLCEMSHCFETDEKVYMALEFMHGGEMFTLLNRVEKFTEEETRFYTAELILALGHLHSNDVIYRDLKHSNVLINRFGHVKLTDFGFCKFNFPKGKKTSTFCGTIEFMAPEIVKCDPYGHEVDVWSLGCLVYDMLTGGPPFIGDTDEETKLNIMNKPLRLQASFSAECRELLQRMLKRRVNSRIEIEELKELDFFCNMDWKVLAAQNYPPPFKPEVIGDEDVSQFEACFTDLPPQESPCKVMRTVEKIVNTDPFVGFDYDGEPKQTSPALKSKSSACRVLKPHPSSKKISPKQRRQK